MWEFIGGVLMLILYVMFILFVIWLILMGAVASIIIGVAGGVFIGFFKGIINYFSALKEETRGELY